MRQLRQTASLQLHSLEKPTFSHSPHFLLCAVYSAPEHLLLGSFPEASRQRIIGKA